MILECCLISGNRVGLMFIRVGNFQDSPSYLPPTFIFQAQLDASGHGQKVVLNGMDDLAAAQSHVATGAAGAMFDHWSILQFVNRTTGEFNATMMDEVCLLLHLSLSLSLSVSLSECVCVCVCMCVCVCVCVCVFV